MAAKIQKGERKHNATRSWKAGAVLRQLDVAVLCLGLPDDR